MLDIVYSLALMFIEVLIYYRILNHSLKFKFNKRFQWVVLVVEYAIVLLRYFITESSNVVFINNTIHGIVFLSIFAIPYFFYEGRLAFKAITSFIFVLFLAGSEVVVILGFMFFSGETMSNLSNNEIYYVCLTITSKIVLIILMKLFENRKKILLEFPKRFWKEIMIIVVMDVIFILYASRIWGRFVGSKEVSVSVVISTMLGVVCIMSILTVAILYKLAKQAERELEDNLRHQHIENEIKLNRDMTSIVESLRSLRHDMNAHMGILKGLLELEEYEDLSNYLDSICEELNTANHFIMIHDRVLSVLINSKIAKAVNLGIDFQPFVSITKMNMEDRDMCSLFGNILDNAIEAAEHVKQDKYIQFTMEEKGERLFIHCENTYAVKPINKGGRYLTTKANQNLHGIGTGIIKSIVEKYNGIMDVIVDELFIVDIVIPYDTQLINNE